MNVLPRGDVPKVNDETVLKDSQSPTLIPSTNTGSLISLSGCDFSPLNLTSWQLLICNASAAPMTAKLFVY